MAAPDPSLPFDRVETLYVDHHGWLRLWLRRRLGCADQAADLAHDTFMSILLARGATAGEAVREPRAFLSTVARRLMANQHRRQLLESSYLEMLVALPEAVTPPPEVRLQALETLQQVDRVLDGLPSRVREAFLLAHLEALSYAEIAQRLGVSMSSVKQYLTRANRECLFAIAG